LPALDAAHVGIRSVTLSRPSLDDVFLKHTGKAFSSETLSTGGDAWWSKWQKGGGGSWGNKQWSESSTEEKGSAGAGQTSGAGAAAETANTNGAGAPAWKQWSGESTEGQPGTRNGGGQQGQVSGPESWPQQRWDKDKGGKVQ
jgi:hypothetical protein